jgi:hypothetical protein
VVRDLMAGGFDHLGALRQELRGNQRSLKIHFRASSRSCCGGAATRSKKRRPDVLRLREAEDQGGDVGRAG